MPIVFPSPAKINFYLDVLARRADGYHEVDTVLLATSLADRLSVEAGGPRPKGSGPLPVTVEVFGTYAGVVPPGDGNLVVRALWALERDIGKLLPPLVIRLEKNVPAGAGLGGGSSNAATALVAANAILELGLPPARLEAIAARIGSDCPFFIRGGAARGTGRGEILEPIPLAREFHLLVAWPRFAISTAVAYGALNETHRRRVVDVEAVLRYLRGEEGKMPPLHNAFQEALVPGQPAIGAVLAALDASGATTSLLSGSGSATFGIYPSAATRDAAIAAIAPLADTFPCTVSPVPRDPLPTSLESTP